MFPIYWWSLPKLLGRESSWKTQGYGGLFRQGSWPLIRKASFFLRYNWMTVKKRPFITQLGSLQNQNHLTDSATANSCKGSVFFTREQDVSTYRLCIVYYHLIVCSCRTQCVSKRPKIWSNRHSSQQYMVYMVYIYWRMSSTVWLLRHMMEPFPGRYLPWF